MRAASRREAVHRRCYTAFEDGGFTGSYPHSRKEALLPAFRRLDDRPEITKIIGGDSRHMAGVTGRKEANPMSLSHFRYPFDLVHRPAPEPEVKRAILASFASEPAGKRAIRRVPGSRSRIGSRRASRRNAPREGGLVLPRAIVRLVRARPVRGGPAALAALPPRSRHRSPRRSMERPLPYRPAARTRRSMVCGRTAVR